MGFWVVVNVRKGKLGLSILYKFEFTRDFLRSFVLSFFRSIITAMCYCRNLHAIA